MIAEQEAANMAIDPVEVAPMLQTPLVSGLSRDTIKRLRQMAEELLTTLSRDVTK